MGSRKNKQAKAKKKRERQRQRNMKGRGRGSSPHTAALGGNTRGRRSEEAVPFLAKPKPFPGESIEDQAVLAASAETDLSPELLPLAEAVRSSLKLVFGGDFEAAVAALRPIPRTSPYADWRMFVRGLISFYQDDLIAAQNNWRSLDSNRRPGIIAAVLLQSADVPTADAQPTASQPTEQSAADAQTASPETADDANGDDRSTATEKNASRRQQKAGLVKRLRDERVDLKIPRQIAATRHRDPVDTFSASQLSLLVNWRNAWKNMQPELVRKFEAACLQLAFMQPNVDLFQVVIQRIPGPPQDPTLTLFSYLFYQKFSGAEQLAAEARRKYIDLDLPRIAELTADTRGAIASLLHFQHVLEEETAPRWMSFLSSAAGEDVGKIYRQAIAAYPKNREAHQAYLGWLENETQNSRDKRERTKLEKEFLKAYMAWQKALPDDVEPRLWLIDHYLDEGDLEQAQKIVASLDGVRLEDPNVKALPWKIMLRKTMSISRQKRQIEAARGCLADAVAAWPAWLSKDWLGFLQAALELRAGDLEAFALKKQAAGEVVANDPLLCDIMLFAALQIMNVPAATLKPYRDALDRQVAGINALELAPLTRLGSFFWDLQRTGLSYPALRMHGAKFGKRFVALLKALRPDVSTPGINETCLWAAKSKFWSTNYDPVLPAWLRLNAKTNRFAALAILRMIVSQTYFFSSFTNNQHLLPLLEEWAKSETDPFYRHLLAATVASAKEKQSELNDRYGAGMFGAMGGRSSMFGDDDDDFDDDFYDLDDELDDDDFDDEFAEGANQCNCEDCRARRARARSRGKSIDVDPEDEFPDLPAELEEAFNDGSFLENLPPAARIVFEKLGLSGTQEFMKLDVESPAELMRLFEDYGVSPMQALNFMAVAATALPELEKSRRRK